MELIYISLLIIISIGLVYTIYRDMSNRENEFQLKLESLKKSPHPIISKMSYKDLIEIVNTNLNYYVDEAIIQTNIRQKTDEERSLILDSTLITICAKVEASLSESVVTGILTYVSESFMRTYIKDSARLLLVAKIERK